MKKLLIIAGLTGSGKTQLAQNIANTLGTKIIVGDCLQMYKNWPIASNWPKDHQNYLLIGQYDCLTQSISSVDYKNIVSKQLEQFDQPMIEGGCCFYLNYLLNSRKETFTQAQINEADLEAIKLINESNNPQETLKKYYPKYQNTLCTSDRYRLIKALRYALLTKGEQITSPFNQNVKTIAEQYDIRAFFLTGTQDTIYQKIYKRCDQMINEGICDEFYQFYLKNQNTKEKATIPIGYEDFENLLQYYKTVLDGRYISQKKLDKIRKERVNKFIQSFYINSRQYAAYQRKYFRNNLNNFLWIDTQQINNAQIILQNYESSREEYEQNLLCDNNNFLKQYKSSTKFGKLADPLPPIQSEKIVLNKLVELLQ